MSQEFNVEYQYFPGCSLHGTAREYDRSLKSVAARLGITLRELEDWSCCGATAARSISEPLALTLAARNLAQAQRCKKPLLVACNLCYSNLSVAARSFQDEDARKAVNNALRGGGPTLDEVVPLVHPLEVINRNVGLERVSANVVFSLKGLKVVSYYGCLLTRPRRVSIKESNFDPRWLDELMASIGAQPLPFPFKTRCCGGPLLMTHSEAAYSAAKKLLDQARDLGAQCIVTTCPQCQMSLGGKQRTIEGFYNTRYGIGVLYFTQLVGLALGASPKELGLPKNFQPN